MSGLLYLIQGGTGEGSEKASIVSERVFDEVGAYRHRGFTLSEKAIKIGEYNRLGS